MWLPPVVTVEPVSEPVAIAEARAQCRVDGTDSDTELNIYIQAARQLVEKFTATALVSQTQVLRTQYFEDMRWLPVAPISAVSSIAYLDTNGAEQTLSTDIYESVLVGLEPAIRLKINQSWPSARPVSDAVRVTVVAGYPTVPTPIKQAILLAVSAWNDERMVGALPEGALQLLSNYRRF